MKMREWDEAGLEPLFGQQGEWLANVLDRASSAEAAAYALHDTGRPRGRRRAGHPSRNDESTPRRFLVASALGLLDARYTPDVPAAARLEARLIVWPEVRGLELLTETSLDDAFRHRTAWRLRLGEPDVEIADPPTDAPLLDFWHECALRAGRPVVEEPEVPE